MVYLPRQARNAAFGKGVVQDVKKFLFVVCAAVLAAAAFFLYSLATVELPEPASNSSTQTYSDVEPIQSRPESSSSAPSEPVSDLSFLSEEQRNVFAGAQETVPYLADPSNLMSREGNAAGEEVQLDGQNYLLITGQDENYEDFRARMLGIFTENCLNQLDFDLRYRSVEGKLAALVGGMGGAINYAECPDTYRLESSGDDELTFTLIGHYIEQRAGETDTEFLTRRANGEFDSTQEFTIRLANTENGWRIDEFHSPLYPYTF